MYQNIEIIELSKEKNTIVDHHENEIAWIY